MREIYIKEYLEEAKNNLASIKHEFAAIVHDENIKTLKIAKVKNCLENFRTSLDYCAKDIYDLILKETDGLDDMKRIEKYKTLYFPYGKNEIGFKSMIGKFPNLKSLNIDIYNLIENIQPYKCNDFWLYNICVESNNIKHDNPGQKRTDDMNQIIFGSFKLDKSSSLHFGEGVVINGIKMPENFQITSNTPIDELRKHNIDIVRINWTNFTFENTKAEVIGLLEKSLFELTLFFQKLYEILERKQ